MCAYRMGDQGESGGLVLESPGGGWGVGSRQRGSLTGSRSVRSTHYTSTPHSQGSETKNENTDSSGPRSRRAADRPRPAPRGRVLMHRHRLLFRPGPVTYDIVIDYSFTRNDT